MSSVYRHTFPNGAVYIGKTDMKPEDRWLNGWGYKNCPLMFNAILQFGWDNVKHEILADNLTSKEALELETKEIKKHTLSNEMVYNISQLPAQFLAQNNSHYIDNSAQNHPQIKAQNTPHKRIHTGVHLKQHIVPIVPKPPGTQVYPIDVYTTSGEFICTYPSAKVAAHELSVNHGDVISCCKGAKSNGQPRYQVKGYVFRYHITNKEVG